MYYYKIKEKMNEYNNYKGKLAFTGVDVYKGDFVDGYRHGYGTYFWKKTKIIYHGEWNRGKKHGTGKFNYTNG